MTDFLVLASLKRFSSAGALLMRVVVGAFLLWTIRDVLPSEAHQRAFAAYLAKFHFPLPYLMARISVYAQALMGVGFITGFLTRWAGLLCAIHFAVALAMVDRFAGIRGAFPAASLLVIGIFLAFHGAGRFGFDVFIEERVRQRFDSNY
jgi:putative oxidoreductase